MKQKPFDLRSLVIASRIFLPEASAASFRLGAVAKRALRESLSVTVLTTCSKGPYPHSDPRLQVRRFPVLRDKSGYVRGYLPYLSFDIPLFFRLLFTKKPDIVLVEPPPTTGVVVRIACFLRRIPYVWYGADVWSDATRSTSAHPLIVHAVRVMEQFAIRGSAGIIAVSPGVEKRIRDLGGRNVRVIENGIDTDVYSPSVPKPSALELSQLGIHRDYFLYAGTASEWQRAEEFATAFVSDQYLRANSQLVFVGNGSSWPILEKIQLKSGGTGQSPLVLLNPTEPENVARLLRGAKAALVSVAPGKDYDFAYPTKVLAALSCGTPVIYAGPGAAGNDIAEGNFGVAIDLIPAEIQTAMNQMLKEQEDEDQSQAAHQWVIQNRSLERTGKSVISFLQETFSRRVRK